MKQTRNPLNKTMSFSKLHDVYLGSAIYSNMSELVEQQDA